MAKKLIGLTDCPDCGHKAAEVGLDKKDNPYRVCILGECDGAQHFTHGKPGRVKNLLAKTRAIAGVDLAAIAKRFNVTLPASSSPAPAPAASSPASSSSPAPDPAAAPAKKKSSLTIF